MSARFHQIAARLGGRLVRHAPLTGGVSASVTALHLATPDGPRAVVVRQLPEQAGDVLVMEHALMTALHAEGWPVPEPLLLQTDGDATMAMAFVSGTAEVAPPARAEALRQMAAFLGRLHARPLTGLPDLPRRADPLPPLPALLPPAVRSGALLAALAARRPLTPARSVLLHGDFWPGNLLWQGGQLAAVIDWEDAAIGDPLSDLASARVELLWKYGADEMASFTAHYLNEHPIPTDDLPVWELYAAAARLAAMHQWGLPEATEADMRRKGAALIQRAVTQILAP